MQKPIGKVTDLSSLLQASDFFANFIFFLIFLTVELEAAKKALSKEKTARLAVEHSLVEEKAAR
jgi:glycopeptide antibiotics resistance protein